MRSLAVLLDPRRDALGGSPRLIHLRGDMENSARIATRWFPAHRRSTNSRADRDQQILELLAGEDAAGVHPREAAGDLGTHGRQLEPSRPLVSLGGIDQRQKGLMLRVEVGELVAENHTLSTVDRWPTHCRRYVAYPLGM